MITFFAFAHMERTVKAAKNGATLKFSTSGMSIYTIFPEI